MKKFAVLLLISMGLALRRCGNTAVTIEDTSEMQTETASEPESTLEAETGTDVSQGGPYGKISITLPAGWCYETCPIDSEQLVYGEYGIHFYPEGVSNGYVALAYIDFFGVCGTGLEEKTAVIAGMPANIGTYDNHEYWDFISFQEENKGIVALTYYVEDWWSDYGSQVIDILDTLSFDQSVKEGGAYIYNAESEVEEIGLSVSLKNITPTGATFVFHQYDAEAPTGELMYGDEFTIETLKNGKWEQAPIVIEGNYGFNALAYLLASNNNVEKELNWEWLYGALAPGEYRIKKDIDDFRESGDYDKYTIYTYFILN